MGDSGYNYESAQGALRGPASKSSNLAKALRQAAYEAQLDKATSIKPKHLLLGLLRHEDAENSGARAVLSKLDVDVDALLSTLAARDAAPVTDDTDVLPLEESADARQVMAFALNEGQKQQTSPTRTEHLLAGLVRNPGALNDDSIARLLAESGAPYAAVTARIRARKLAREMVTNAAPRDYVALATKDRKASPVLDKYSRDFTQDAIDDLGKAPHERRLTPYIGDDDHVKLREIKDILSKRHKRNPCLVGEPGIGKSAAVEGLAPYLLLHPEEFPAHLRGKHIRSLNLGAMISGSKYRGEFEERLTRVIEEAKANGDILFLDELHNVLGAGAAEGAVDASSILKPFLARGDFPVIGATTLDEYRKHIEKDAALERRFRPVHFEEPNRAKTLEILHGLREINERTHDVRITDDALEAAVRLSDRYVTTRNQPDKSVDLIDEACARAKNKALEPSAETRALEARVQELAEAQRNAKTDAQRQELRNQEIDAREELILASTGRPSGGQEITVDAESVAEVVAIWTGVPTSKLSETDQSRLMRMEEELHKRVIGQEAAVAAVAKAVRRARSGVKDPKKPTGVFLFLGPTGVGKTELAKALAEFMFDDEDSRLVRLDMSEFQEKHTVSRLVGAPPGYIGSDEAGQLTEPVRNKKYCVVLLDEIEKAHEDIYQLLLQVMDEGRLTDSKGRKANFKESILIMTSNLGAKAIAKAASPGGWGVGGNSGASQSGATTLPYQQMRDNVLAAVNEKFQPEWLNRIDKIIVFGHLSRDELAQVVDIKVAHLDARLFDAKQIHIELTQAARDQILELGYDPAMGARPVERAITAVEDKLAEFILTGTATEGMTVKVGYDSALAAKEKAGDPGNLSVGFTFDIEKVVEVTGTKARTEVAVGDELEL